MASKTKCACCTTLFLGTPISCKACGKPACAICRTNGSQPGKCCKCSNEQCARSSGPSAPQQATNSYDNSDSSVSDLGEPDPSLQNGFMHPETKFGRRYKGVGPRGPALAEFQKDSRWSWEPYQQFVKHVYKHMESRKQIEAEEFRECATFVTDYGIDSPGWNGLLYDPELKLSEGPHPNYYEPEPVEALKSKVSLAAPDVLDPPDSLVEISSALANDPSSYFCYKYLWAPNTLEDPNKYPFAFATVGSEGVHFFNQQHVMTKEYRPNDKISAIAADLASESFIYLHQDAQKVTVGSLSDPDDIVLEFDLPSSYAPQAIGVMNTSNGNQLVIHGAEKNVNYVKLFDLNSGAQTASLPIRRFDYETKYPVISRGATQPNLVMDPVRPNVCYLGLLSETGFAIVDTRMSRAARWVRLQNEISNMIIQSYGNCDKLLYTKGDNLVMYDLTAGKARYSHTTLGTSKAYIGVFGLATHGEQIAVGRFNNGGPEPIVSWLSWEHFESGSYFDTKKDHNVPGSGGNFIAVNSNGILVMEHNHAMHAPWQAPLGGKALVKQVSAPSATASGVAPAQKGVRRAKRETAANSFADPVNAPVPTKPQEFTLKYEDYSGIPSIAEHDHHDFSKQMWAASGLDDPSKYPFRVLCCGSKGIAVYDHEFNVSGDMCSEYDVYSGVNCVHPDAQTKTLLVGSNNNSVSLFSFDGLFKKPKSTIANFGYTPQALTTMHRSTAQIVIGGDELQLFDMETGRRVGEVLVTHGSTKSSIYGLRCDRNRPDVLYAQGLEQAFLIDLRENAKQSVRSFAPSKQNHLFSTVNTEYGTCDKLIVTNWETVSLFDIGTGKAIIEVEGASGDASAYGSTLCVGTYESAVVYYDIENLAAGPVAVSELPNSESPRSGSVRANWKGVYRKAADKLFFYPFKGTKL